MKKPLVGMVICITVALLGGCASIPDMTEEQGAMVSEYAAALMLKYDVENHSRLVDVDDYVEEYTMKKLAFEEAAKKYLEEQQKLEEEQRKEEEERMEETAKQEQILSGNGNSGSKEESGSGLENVIIVDNTKPLVDNNEPIASYIGVGNFDINYLDVSVTKELVTKDAFDISAAAGSELMVVSFEVKNLSSESAKFDVLSKDVKFKFSVNGGKYISAKINPSDDDLAQAYLSFVGGENKLMSLIIEIEEGIAVNSLSMSIEIDGKSPIVKILR